MNYAQDIFNQCVNQWNSLAKKEKDNYLKEYVKTI